MSLGDKLAKLRKDNNYTQEQLADILGVSRQSVSKWESDVAYPETDKLIKLGELYDCSIDYLVKDNAQNEPTENGKDESSAPAPARARFDFKNLYYERKSSKTIRGVPLWHVNIGFGRTAKGIIAVGLNARGVISFGLLSMGVLSFGVCSLGLISLGAFALGLIALGAISAGAIAVGAICVGLLAIGAVAIGEFSVGALAIGKYFAMGDHAYAMIAIGKTKAVGTVYRANTITAAERPEIIALLKANVPEIFHWLIELIKPLLMFGLE